MTYLKKAPLIYTIGMIKFPRIPSIDRFIDSFHDQIRNEYPFCEEFKISILNAEASSQGIQLLQQENKVWQITSVDQNWAFVLSDQSFCLHTVSYQEFSQFSDRFKACLNILLHIPEIGIDWITMIGIRYVNLIETQTNKKIYEYLHPWALPSEPPSHSLSIIEGAYVTRYKTTHGELRLQSLKNPQLTLPPDLHSPLIIKNGWIKNRPKHDFALIDIDHNITFNHPIKITLSKFVKDLSDLHDLSKTVFESTGTKLSHKIWKGK